MTGWLSWIIVLALLLVVAMVSVRKRKLTGSGGIAAIFTGLLVFAGAGYIGVLLLAAFFIMGTVATSHRKDLKAKLQAGGEHPEARNAGQVLANGGTAVLTALLALINPHAKDTYTMMLAAGLAAATADTLSSELGMVYGRHTINILTFKKEAPGLDGVVSLEGTLLGAAGALLIALIHAVATGSGAAVLFITLGGVLGNLADSVLGASLERRHYIGNNGVNFLNTLFGALAALLFICL
ncbi:DUF92 domain-containing protein [uncultured Chitinophaga sp.]|uniref:DUF92 domain-containing protein n=1 Tax=uncultured Chitinophaga sp. TaxID=339340 RepID=UPI0026232002|nr:DUF92 domain-containing protein [uncultured Chitinophaga sp.]